MVMKRARIIFFMFYVLFCIYTESRSFAAEGYAEPVLLTTIPEESVASFTEITFNQKGDFAFIIPQYTKVKPDSDEESEITQTDIFLFERSNSQIKKLVSVPNLVGSLRLIENEMVIFENYSGIKRTEGVFSYDLLNKKLHDVGGEWLTRYHERFPGIHYSPLASEGERFLISANDAQDLKVLYRQKGSEFQKILWSAFQFGQKKGINFLFNPGINSLGDVAIKIQIGSREDLLERPVHQQIIIIDAKKNASHRVIAETTGEIKYDRYYRITNGVIINNYKNCAFLAQKRQDSPTGLFFYNYDHETVSGYESPDLRGDFGPTMNDNNRIVFWSRSIDGKRTLNYWDPEEKNSTVKQVVTEFSNVAGYQITRLFNELFINNKNEIYFVAKIKSLFENPQEKFAVFYLTPELASK